MDYSVSMDTSDERQEKRGDPWKVALIIFFIIVVIIAGIIGLVLHFNKPKPVENVKYFNTAVSMAEFFNVSDAYDVTWAHAVNNKAALREALENDDVMMLEADLIVRWQGLSNQTDEPIMAHPPDVTSDLTFAEFLDAVIQHPNKGMKLDFKFIEAVEPALKLLKERRASLRQPVLLNANILPGPYHEHATRKPVDPKRFFKAIDDYFPDASTLSVDWLTGFPPPGSQVMPYSRDMVEAIYDQVKDRREPATLPVHAGLAVLSWDHLKWFLQQDPSRFSLTLWLGTASWDGLSPYNLMYVRNNYNKSYIYYDLPPGANLDKFRSIIQTAGTPLNAFDVGFDTLNLMWARDVNSEEALTEALSGSAMMLQADVSAVADVPVVGSSNFTLEAMLSKVSGSRRGVMLSLVDNAAVHYALTIVRDANLTSPIWIHADVKSTGSGSRPSVSALVLADSVQLYGNETTLVLGWVSGDPINEYITSGMMDEMMVFVNNNFIQPIVFRVRATMALRSWPQLQRALDEPLRGFGVLIWAKENDLVDPDDLVNIRNRAGWDRVFFDLPPSLMDSLKSRL